MSFLNFISIKPIWGNKSPVIQLIYFLLLAIASFFLSYLIGLIFIFVFTSFTIDTLFLSLNNYVNSESIKALKILQLCNQFLFFIATSIVWVKLCGKKILADANYKFKSEKTVLVIVFSLACIPLINYLGIWNNSLHLPKSLSDIEVWMRNAEAQAEQLTKAFLIMPTLTDLIINTIIIALLAAVGEELFFRSVLQNTFANIFNKKIIAIILASIVFSAIHLQFFGFFPRMVLGILYGIIFFETKNIFYPILAHFTNNFFAIFTTYLINNKIVNYTENELVNFISQPIVLIISFVIAILSFVIIVKNKKNG